MTGPSNPSSLALKNQMQATANDMKSRRKAIRPFLLVVTSILAVGYFYLASRIATSLATRILLFVPFAAVWIVPVRYWGGERQVQSFGDDLLHFVSYLSMGWLNFLMLLAVTRDVLLLAARAFSSQSFQDFLTSTGLEVVWAGSIAALVLGFLAAFLGPSIKAVDVPCDGLPPALEGFRIVQISDLHVGPTIGRRYVERVVEKVNGLRADLVAITGDLVDGSVARLAASVQPLAELAKEGRAFFVLGNHDYYSGAEPWVEYLKTMGVKVLKNDYALLDIKGQPVVVGGVTDPAAALFRPDEAPNPELATGPGQGTGQPFRLLLAHNPKIAPLAAEAGFDLQLSGHTHAGQFFPWTLAVALVHSPHAAGLSREARMWVYVSSGTGTWGPPIRFGTRTELTILRLTRGNQVSA